MKPNYHANERKEVLIYVYTQKQPPNNSYCHPTYNPGGGSSVFWGLSNHPKSQRMKITQLSVVALFFGSFLWLSNSTGALPENTNAPGELTCGRAPCHNIPNNVGSAQIGIDVDEGAGTYRAGDTLTVTVSIEGAQSPRNGFQITALDAANQKIGTWVLTAPQQMQVINGIGLPRRYVTHRAAGNMQASWSMEWAAPEEDAGDITFYASVLDANNNGTNTGDALYTTTSTASFEPTNAIWQPDSGLDVKIYPNPATEVIFVHSPKNLLRAIRLIDSQGRELRHWPASRETNRLEASGLSAGIYFLLMETENGQVVRKIAIQR